MPELIPLLLLIHLAGVMVGLGPTFVFARITATAARQPEHARFASRLVQDLSSKWAHPIAGVVLVSGLLLVWSIGYDLLATGWLLLSLVLFVPSFLYAAVVQNPDIGRVLALTDGGPPEPGSPAAAELARRRVRIRRGGLYMRATALIILVLMVLKPF